MSFFRKNSLASNSHGISNKGLKFLGRWGTGLSASSGIFPASRGGRMLDKKTFFNWPFVDLTLIASPLMISKTMPLKSFSFAEKVAVGGW